MSYPEFQTEEKAVQLTSEDIRILSEYSWDMAGYTSRFGFFYQGNENADIDGLTKWQAEHIFQLTPIPPGMEDELQNMEKTKRISKEKKKEIIKKKRSGWRSISCQGCAGKESPLSQLLPPCP